MQKSEYVLFFDDGGVINDNEARAPQWQKLIAEYFIPKYGGTFQQWKDANLKVLFKEIEFFANLLINNIYFDFSKYLDDSDERWIALMFENLEIPVPDRNECIKLARAAYSWIIPQVKSAYDGMNELIIKLSYHFDLYTSSGTDYSTLKAYYKSQGIDHCFKKLYGSDLVGVFKSHPDYFNRVFKDSGVDPNNAIIIDDKEKVLDLVDGFGAKCLVSNLSGATIITGNYPVFNNPNELIKLISEITGVMV
ncbi:MAG: HAD family hydrolase [Candidatus Heimdallarchaeota archaeon]|nr:HAD family hydrolase [Candidatus Heimdallarchaeota archaeon]